MIPLSAHLSMLFTELPALQRPAAARAAGFGVVESWWPVADDVDGWVGAVTACGLGVSCLNADGGDIAAGERGFCNLPERHADTLAGVDAALELAVRVGAGCVNVLPGLVVADRSRRQQLDHAVAVYRELGGRALACGRTVVVEPINAFDVPAYLTPAPADVAELLRRVDHPNVRMLFDAYHCARGGGDPIADVRVFADLIGHVQYADSPGRGAPGTGAVPFGDFLESLDMIGYRGAVGMEYAPAGPTADSLGYLSGD